MHDLTLHLANPGLAARARRSYLATAPCDPLTLLVARVANPCAVIELVEINVTTKDTMDTKDHEEKNLFVFLWCPSCPLW